MKCYNKEVFKVLNEIIADKAIQLTYLPGNHDLLVTAENINSVLPNIHQARDIRGDKVLLGLGSYSPSGFPEAVIEHGHRCNFFCAPDPISNRNMANGTILPPGYFFTRIAVESYVTQPCNIPSVSPHMDLTYRNESQFLCSVYGQLWESSFKRLPVKRLLDEKFIVTNIDGMKVTYSKNDLFPQQDITGNLQTILYPGIQDTWQERQWLNYVAVFVPTLDAIQQAHSADFTDEMSNVQYFSNTKSDKRVVVFGHSHVPRMITYPTHDKQKGIYANTGTWVDNNKDNATMTFVVLYPPRDSVSLPLFVNLYQYLPDGDIVNLDGQAYTR